jgi:hypothetical protein
MEEPEDLTLVAAVDRVAGIEEVVGDQADLHPLAQAPQRLDHLVTDVAVEQRQHLGTPYRVARRAALGLEQDVELRDRAGAALELRPGVVVRVGGVDAPQETRRQPALPLEPREGFEGAGRNHAAKVPDDCFDR